MLRKAAHPDDANDRLSFWLLVTYLVVLWIGGGASRADVSAQPVIRFVSWLALIVLAMFGRGVAWRRSKAVAILLTLSVLLVIVQLIPLPPSVWSALPGRDLFVRAAEVSAQPQPWRPISISPGTTANALWSLVVPITAFVLSTNLTRDQHWRICGLLLALIVAGCLEALLQFSGSPFRNPLINAVKGSVSGNFANRNHFALFVALGCLIAPVWGFTRAGASRWKSITAIALLPLFLLVILATGSRAGMLLGSLAILAGLSIVRTQILAKLRSLPRWLAIGTIAAGVSALVSAVVLSIVLGRAEGLERAMALRMTADLRSQALPYVIEAIGRYFPVGAGFGTFDATYRIVEPDALLQTVYFNHAHNDWLEVVLDGGIAGAALLLAGVTWGFVAAVRVWRGKSEGATTLGRMASVILLLILLASVPDYPLRTPMMMVGLVLAAVWLSLAADASVGASSQSTTRPTTLPDPVPDI